MDNNYGNMNDTNNANNTNNLNSTNNTNNIDNTNNNNNGYNTNTILTIRMSHRRQHRLIIHLLRAIQRATIRIHRLLQQDRQMQISRMITGLILINSIIQAQIIMHMAVQLPIQQAAHIAGLI